MKHNLLFSANGLCTPPCGSSHGKSLSFQFRNSLLLLFLLMVGSSAVWGAFTPGTTYYVDLRTVDFYKKGAVLLVNFYDGDTYQGDGNRAAVKETGVSHIYSFTIPSITTDNFKIVRLDPSRTYRWNQTVKMYQNAAGTNNCINLTSWPSGDVPCSWTTYTPGAPTPYTGNLYLIGGACTGQDWGLGNAVLLDNDGHGIYTITHQINAVTGDNSDGFKFLESANWDPQWRPTPENATVSLSDGGKAQDVAPGQTNIVIKKNPGDPDTKWHLTTSGTYTITIDLSDRDNGKMSIEAATPAEPDPKPVLPKGSFYLFGAGGTNWLTDWSQNIKDSYKMDVADGVATKTMYNVSGNGCEFKIRNFENGQKNGDYTDYTNSLITPYNDPSQIITKLWKDGATNIAFNLKGSADVTVHFDGGRIWLTAVEHVEPAATYTVTLHPNNGGASTIVKENVPEGSNSSAAELNLAAVTYGLGTATWYTNPECTTPFSTVTSDMHLYAKWGVSGNYYFVSCLQTANDNGGENGNWSNNYGQQLAHTFIAPSGHMPFEVIKDKDWNQKINGGNYSDMFDNSKSNVTVSAAHGHMDFTLSEPKQVTVAYNGKVSVNVADYSFDNSKTWRIKTSWGNGGAAGNYNTLMTNNGSTNATAILYNVPAGQNSFVVTTKDNDNDAMATVGTETFNALYVDTSNPSSGLTWNTTSARRDGSDNFNSTTPQTDNRKRNCSFTLAAVSDIRISFDGGKIRCDIVAPNTVIFNTDGGSTIDPAQVSDGSPVAQPADPTKAGYIFSKWQLKGSDYNFSNPVTENITLDAVWAYKAIESVSLNKSSLTLFENSTPQTLTASYLPADVIGVTNSWSVDPAGVVNVVDGVVSVVAPGTATITCTATDQESHSQTATCAVTVHAGEGCEMEETPIAQLTVDQMEQSGMFTESMNTEPEQLNKIQLKIGSQENHVAYVDPSDPNVKHGEGNSDYHYWYLIEAGTASYAANGGKLYYLKNVGNGKYLCISDVNIGGGNWGSNYTITADKTSANEAKCTWFFKSSHALRLVNLSTKKSDNTAYTRGEMFLHRYSNVSSPAATYVVTGSSDGDQGNWQLTPSFINTSSVANPNYLSTPIVYNTRSYYRFAQDAAISMTLDKKLREEDKIVVYCYNPSNAASNGGLYINNNKVSDIPIPANSAIEFEYEALAANSGQNAIAVKSNDNNFCVAAVNVLRSLPVVPQDPTLTWSAPATYYTTIAAGNFTFAASSAKSSGAISYTSSDENVATVDANGTVTPSTIGTTTITASIEQYLCFGESSIQYDVVVELPLQEAINATAAKGTLTLTHDYNENAVINKAITINGQGHTIGDLTVQTAGDLTLSSGLKVQDFTICAKAGNTTTPAASGQVRNANNLTCTGNAYFLYTVDPSGHVQYCWYDFTVPFPVNVMTGIKGIQNDVMKETFANEVDYAIMEYLGERKAQGQYPYQKFRGVMQPNQLYSITLDSRDNYNTVRFQKTADGDLVANDNVTLHPYAGSGAYTNLNGVGNGTLHHADADNLSSNRVQVYQSGYKTFLTVDKTQYSFVVGTAFMVQEAGTMTLSQANDNKPLLAPSRYESAPATAIQIAREGQPFSDQLFISASETGGQAYTPGTDLAKAGNIGNVNVPQIWTNAYNTKLCVHEAQLINGEASYNLSLYAPAADTYTLTSRNIPADYSLYLTQNGMVVSELSDTYTLDLNKGITTEYGLLLVETYKTPTGIENTQTDKIQTTKIIHNGVLYILHNGKIYNAQGAKVK